MKRRPFVHSLIAGGISTVLGAHRAHGQSDRPVVLLVPFAAGGASDALARQVAPHLAKTLERTVIVDNVPGASGTLAAQRLLTAAPDGSTMMVVSSSETILPPLVMPSVKFQAEDFRLLVGGMDAPVALLGRVGLEATQLTELLLRAGTTPTLSYGSLGNGTIAHLAAEHFSMLTGVGMIHVPYRGGAPLITDLLANQIDLGFLPLAGPVLQLAETGKLKVYGLASSTRAAPFEKYPLLTAHPALKTFEHTAWTAFAVAKSVPEPVSERLNETLNAILQLPEVRDFARRMGSHVPKVMSLPQVAAFYEREISLMRNLARTVNLQQT